MLAFLCDNTFEGILSAVHDAYITRRFPDLLLCPEAVPPLTVTAAHTVVSSRNKADRVFAGLAKRLSREGKNVPLLAFLSERPDIGTLLFRYMRKIFDASRPPESDFTDNVVLAVDQLARKVYGEHHLLLGFARFQKTADGVYFSALAPKYNVLSLMVPHFRDRFALHPWIIYDARRGYGYFHDRGEIRDVSLDGGVLCDGRLPGRLLAEDEIAFQDMWQSYFATAAIAERANPELQARCLPRRYWPYLTEMQS